MSKNTFGKRLKEVRKDKGLTLKDLANKLELSESTIQRYEAGVFIAPHPTMMLLAKELGVNPVWLMGYPDADKYLPKVADSNVVQVPILGRIETGEALIMRENIVGYEYAPASANVDFCLEVTSDNMINARIFAGDIVCARQQAKVEDGEIAVVIVEGLGVQLYRVYQFINAIVLRSENPKHTELIFKGNDRRKVEILGKVVYLRTEVR